MRLDEPSTDAATFGIHVPCSFASFLLPPRVATTRPRLRRPATGVYLHVGCVCRRGGVPDASDEREGELDLQRWRLGRIWRVIARASSRVRWNGGERPWRARRRVRGAVRGVRRDGRSAWMRG